MVKKGGKMRRVVFVAAAVCVLMAAGCKGEGHSVHVLGPALRISLGAGNPAGRAVDASESGVEALHVKFEIVSGVDVRVRTLTLHARGTGDDAVDVTRVSLYWDANDSGAFEAGSDFLLSEGSFSADDGSVRLDCDVLLNASRSETVVFVLLDFAGNAPLGATFGLSVDSASDVEAVLNATGGGALVEGAPVTGGTFTVQTGAADVNVFTGPANPTDSYAVRNHPEVPVLQFELYARSHTAVVSSLTLHASGTGNDQTALSQVTLWLDGDANGRFSASDVMLDTAVYAADDGDAVFTLNQTVPVGERRYFLITYDVSPTAPAGFTHTCSFAPAADLTVSVSGSPAVVSGDASISGATVTVLDTGTLSVAVGPASPSRQIEASPSQQDVVMLQLRLTAAYEGITVNTVTVTVTSVGGDADADITAVRLYHDADSDGRPGAGDSQTGSDATVSGGSAVVDAGGRKVDEGATEDWLLCLSFAAGAPRGASYQVSVDASSFDTTGEYSGASPGVSGTFPIVSESAVVLFDTFVVAGAMNSRRVFHTATPFYDPNDARWKVLIAGGWDGGGVLDTAEIFDPATRTFSPLSATMTEPRMNHSATLIPGPDGQTGTADDLVMLAGGWNGYASVNSVETFDPAAGTFTEYRPYLVQQREGHTAALLGHRVMFVEGFSYFYGSYYFASKAELIDLDNDMLTSAGNVSCVRMFHGADVSEDGVLLICGGLGYRLGAPSSPLPLDVIELWRLDPQAHQMLTRRLPQARVGHRVVALEGGEFLIFGGYGQNPALYLPPFSQYRLECELLVDGDPNVFGDEFLHTSGKGTLSEVRYLPAAVVLGDGRVLVAGGADQSASPLASAELYDPVAHSFSASSGSLSTARYAAAFCALPGPDGVYGTDDDRAFVSGGLRLWVNPNYSPQAADVAADAEIYLP